MSKRLIIFSMCMLGFALGCTTPTPKATSLVAMTGSSVAQGDFVMTWEVTGHTLIIQSGEGEFDYQVDWDNDGTFDEQRFSGPATHTYATPYPAPTPYAYEVASLTCVCAPLKKRPQTSRLTQRLH